MKSGKKITAFIHGHLSPWIKICISILEICTFILAIIGFIYAYYQFQEWKDIRDTPSLNGNWEFNFYTQNSSVTTFNKSTSTYKLFILGSGNDYKGKGEKVKYNNIEYVGSERDKFNFEINISGDQIYGIYTLEGQERKSDGSFWGTYEYGKMQGSFRGNAADSAGIFSAKLLTN